MNRRPHLIDSAGRDLTYLRVSLTDRCNMACLYCDPQTRDVREAVSPLSRERLLELLTAFAALGVDKIRYTGGEPLLRKDIVDIVRDTSRLGGIRLIGLTTNGILLGEMLDRLIDAGVNRINVSLDTLDRVKFKSLTGVDGLDRVTSAVHAAVRSRAFPRVKVNTVVLRGINDVETPKLAEWAVETGIDIRFIEFMPARHADSAKDLFVGEKEIRKRIKLPLEPAGDIRHNDGPARTFLVRGRSGRVSFISAVTTGFCSGCNRLRLTSAGELRGCLFGSTVFDCRSLLGRGLETDTIADAIEKHATSAAFRAESFRRTRSRTRPSMRGIGG
jgi:cyclic pyranopterin phosphate synthase